jgi:hypothetical protein
MLSGETRSEGGQPQAVEKFSRLVLSFYIKVGYTSIGWSDD